ncbi:Dynamitin-domain-containing protein [Blastocladiella britannica]|nr:Dynamitin-domain-containing protein [Blastocladiella britannica]
MSGRDYTNLPDVVLDQPEIYESPDPPPQHAASSAAGGFAASADSDVDSGDEHGTTTDTDGVVRTSISARAAANRFAGAGVEANDDEDDIEDDANGTTTTTADARVTARAATAGFRTYNRAALDALKRERRAAESPAMRLARLRAEAREIEADLRAAGTSAAPGGDKLAADAFVQLSKLSKDLDDLAARAGGATAAPTAPAEGVASARLMEHLRQYRVEASAAASTPPMGTRPLAGTDNSESAAASSTAGAGGVTYEVYYTPEAAAVVRSAKLAEMDARVHALERLVGHTLEPELVPGEPLAQVLARIDRQLHYLATPRHLDSLTRHLRALNDQLAAAAAVAATAPPGAPGISGDLALKIDALYALVDRIDPLVPVVPRVLDRMAALQTLHADASRLAGATRRVVADQARTERTVRDLADAVTRLEKSVVANAATVEKNVADLESRVAAVADRAARLE